MDSIKRYLQLLMRNAHGFMVAHIAFLSALAGQAAVLDQAYVRLLLAISMSLAVVWLLLLPAPKWEGKQNFSVYPKFCVQILLIAAIGIIVLSAVELISLML